MKIHCGCNSIWEQDWSSAKCSVFQLMVSETMNAGQAWECRKCKFDPWYNPQYENMMHDLREMNRM